MTENSSHLTAKVSGGRYDRNEARNLSTVRSTVLLGCWRVQTVFKLPNHYLTVPICIIRTYSHLLPSI